MFPMANQKGKYNPSWLYTNMAEMYKQWLPEDEQQLTLKNFGYYSVWCNFTNVKMKSKDIKFYRLI